MRPIISSFILFFLATSPTYAQGSKVYIQPEIALNITSAYDYRNSLNLDFGNMNKAIRIEVRGGYNIRQNLSLFTGFGYCAYRYRMYVAPVISGPDTIRTVYQDVFEIPIGVRVSTYFGQRSFKTRFYGAAGVRLCLLNDARHNSLTADGSSAEANVVRAAEYNSFWIRLFAEGGLDIPMDYNTGILIGLNIGSGLTRNMSTDGALTKSNFGVPIIGGSLGLRVGL